MADIDIQCIDCPTKFTFTDGEQRFYAEHNYAQPKRCKICRAAKKARNTSSTNQPQGKSDDAAKRESRATTPSRGSTQWIGGDVSVVAPAGERRERRRDRDRDRKRDRFDD